VHLPITPDNVTVLPCEMQNSFVWCKVCCFPPNIGGSEWQVVLCGNLNASQPASQQVFKVTAISTDARFQSFMPLINRIVHRAVLKFSPCLNKPLPQLVRRPYCGLVYLVYMLLHHARCSDQPGLGQDCRLATCQDWWTGVSHSAEARLCHERDVLAHCLGERH